MVVVRLKAVAAGGCGLNLNTILTEPARRRGPCDGATAFLGRFPLTVSIPAGPQEVI